MDPPLVQAGSAAVGGSDSPPMAEAEADALAQLLVFAAVEGPTVLLTRMVVASNFDVARAKVLVRVISERVERLIRRSEGLPAVGV